MLTRIALSVNLVGFLLIFFGLQIAPSPLSDVVNKAGNVIATCRGDLLYAWPGEGIPDIMPPPGPPVPTGVSAPCPYGERRSHAEVDANHPWFVKIGVAVTFLSIIAQIALVPARLHLFLCKKLRRTTKKGASQPKSERSLSLVRYAMARYNVERLTRKPRAT